MTRWVFRWTCGLAFLLAAAPSVFAQEDYRQYFKPPDTAPEYWKALKFELELGVFKVAAEFLDGFLKKEPSEDFLFELEEKEGMSTFLNLRTVVKWSDDPKVDTQAKKNVEDLINGVSAAVRSKRNNPERIRKLVSNLGATHEERVYAIAELRKTGAEAVPFIVKELQDSVGTQRFVLISRMLAYLDRNSLPALLAALDINDPVIQLGIVEGVRRRPDLASLMGRNEYNPAPYLWHLSASPKSPDYLKKAALSTLAALYQSPVEKLPLARTELTREAERYYDHKIKFPDPQTVIVWQWNGNDLVRESANANRAEEVYGLRFAQKALEIDPGHEPAQIIALAVAVDKAVTAAGLDQPLSKSPKVKELLSSVNPDLVTATLERGLDDKRPGVVLGTTRALGDLGEIKAGRPRNQGLPALVRAVNYPDRRVQFAAADALLRLPGPTPPQASGRVIEVLRRMVSAEPIARVLIGDGNQNRGIEVGKAVKESGFEPIVVGTGIELFKRLQESADIDAILIDFELPQPGLRTLLAQLRADVDSAQLPIFVTIPPAIAGVRPPEGVIALQRMVEPYRNVFVVPATLDPDLMKPQLTAGIAITQGKLLTEAERKAMAAEAMVWLKRIAVGEVPGYKATSATGAILQAMRNEELAPLAVEAAGRLPGREPQRELAMIVLSDAAKPEVRAQAALELARNIQTNSVVLLRNQRIGLEQLFTKTDDARFKSNLALVMGALRPDIYRTADRLRAFVPPVPVAGEKPEGEMKEKAPEKPKEKEAEKAKEKEEKKDN